MEEGLRRRVRPGLSVALVGLACVWVAWLGFGTQNAGDYTNDYAPAMNSLLAGHVGAFFAHLPTNGAGGSVLLRAPAALVGKLLLDDQLAIFRFGALACVLAAALLGLHLARGVRSGTQARLARATVLGVCVLSAALLDAIYFGHPEEPLGAALCVSAVLLAGAQRSGLAGLALGAAMINKPWGILAVGPVLLAAPGNRRYVIVIAGAIVGAWFGAAYLTSPAQFARAAHGASTAVVAHPDDLWWPFAQLYSAPGVTRAYLVPRLISAHARELVVVLAVPMSLALARRRERSTEDCLALLALLFLCRCLLDPSNHVYYQVPFVIALCAWEARSQRFPILALIACAGFWLVFHTVSGSGNLLAQFAAYLAVALPLGARLLRPALGIERAESHATASPRLSTA